MWWFRKGNRRERLADDRGVTAVEYGLIVALIALVSIPAIYFLQNSLSDSYQTTAANDPGVVICPESDPNCSTINALPAANVPGRPLATTLAATLVATTTATLNGSVNANGYTTTVTFCLSTSPSLNAACTGGTVVSATPGTVSGKTATSVSAPLAGLTTGTTYYFRVVAESSRGTAYGATLSFIPQSCTARAPAVTTGGTSGVGPTSAVLSASVDPNGGTTSVVFRYSTDNKLASSQTVVGSNPGTGTTAVNVTGTATPLSSTTKYYYRVEASNCAGSVTGSIKSFTTTAPAAASAPSVANLGASSITQTSATVFATVGSGGAETVVSVCVQTSGNVNQCNWTEVQTVSAATASTLVEFLWPTALVANTEYNFWFRAGNSVDTVTQGPSNFTALAVAPTVANATATAIGTNGATLNGTVNPQGAATTTQFRYCTDEALTTDCLTVNGSDPGTGATAVSVSAPVTGLAPGTRYYFRISATNTGGTSLANDVVSFLTDNASAPSVPLTFAAAKDSNSYAKLTWAAPSSTGGSSLTGYAIRYKEASGPSTCPTDWTGAGTSTAGSSDVVKIIGPLDRTKKWCFQIAATNSVGPGDYTTAAGPVQL